MEHTEIDSSSQNAFKISSKLSLIDWKEIEKPISKLEKKIIQTVMEIGTNISNSELEQCDYCVIGDDLYIALRRNLNIEMNLINIYVGEKDKKKSKKKSQKLSKADAIRLDNSKNKIAKELDNIFESFSTSEFTPQLGFRSDILEIKGITWLYASWYLLNNETSVTEQFILDILIGIQKFLNRCESIEGKYIASVNKNIPISITLVNDVSDKFNELCNKFNYAKLLQDVMTISPKSIIYTEYDNGIPQSLIKPRQHQLDIVNEVKNNFDTGFIISYCAMIGSGKTTAVIAIAKLIEMLRHKTGRDLQLIFCCNIQSVKIQLANSCYNAGIHLGIGSLTQSDYKITPHYGSKYHMETLTIIASPDVVYKILTDPRKKNKEYVLFLDEPSVFADIENSYQLRMNMKVLTVMPKWTILSSATFPSFDEIEQIISDQKRKYPTLVTQTISSNEIQIGCDIKTFRGELIVPHMNVKTKDELKFIINRIKQSPFLGRTYTINIAKHLLSKMENMKLSEISDVKLLFDNVENLSSEKMRKLCINLLEILVDKDDEIIENVCKMNSDLFEEMIDMDKICTTQAYYFPYATLIAVYDPIKFALTHFRTFIDEIKESDIPKGKFKSATNILKIFESDMMEFDKKIIGMEKNIRNEERFAKQYSEYNRPKVQFPDQYQINSSQHIAYFANKMTKINSISRPMLNIEAIINLNVHDDIKILLFSGIGIYCESEILSNEYLQTVLSLSSEGRLAYIISDSSFCYGTNYPINNIIIPNEFINESDKENYSINTIFQLIGRAGRVGKSWQANVYIHENIVDKIVKYIKCDVISKGNSLNSSIGRGDSQEQNNCEAVNMINMYNKLKQEYIDKIKKKSDEIDTALNLKKILTPEKTIIPDEILIKKTVTSLFVDASEIHDDYVESSDSSEERSVTITSLKGNSVTSLFVEETREEIIEYESKYEKTVKLSEVLSRTETTEIIDENPEIKPRKYVFKKKTHK